MDQKINGELSVNACEKSGMSDDASGSVQVDEDKNSNSKEKATPVSNLCSGSSLIQGDESVGKREDSPVNKSSCEADKGRKSSSGKRKIKVDWTPELHRKFVQAVEQLGVDKAVPSKILELMGIDCLTRHNVASHLQKYRSHRKHMLAREAEAATWSQRRQARATTMGKTAKGDVNSWTVPTTGFPPVTTMPHIRPLHVWGHPSADQSLAYMWPAGHVGSSHSPPAWAHAYHPHPQPPPGDPYFWYRHPQDVPAQGMPYFQPHIPPTRFTAPPVSGLPSTSMYRVAPNGQSLHQPSFDSYPSKESIDAVIGEVLSRPWLPLPLGLKPPSIDSVMLELQRQGISKVPPACV